MNVRRPWHSTAPLALALLVAIAKPISADSSGASGLPPLPLPGDTGGLADSIPAPAAPFAPVEPQPTGFS